MKHLSTVQRAYVIRCFASHLNTATTVNYFIDMFPDFGAHLTEETRRNRLTERFKKIKQKHADEILEVRDEDPNARWHIPLAHPAFRIRCLKNLYDETIEQLEQMGMGKAYETNAKDRLKILKAIQQETDNLKYEIPPELYDELSIALTKSLSKHLTDEKTP